MWNHKSNDGIVLASCQDTGEEFHEMSVAEGLAKKGILFYGDVFGLYRGIP